MEDVGHAHVRAGHMTGFGYERHTRQAWGDEYIDEYEGDGVYDEERHTGVPDVPSISQTSNPSHLYGPGSDAAFDP